MSGMNKSLRSFVYLIIFLLALSPVAAQKKSKNQAPPMPQGKRIMWEQTSINQKDLFYGPGGKEMLPDLRKITFIKEEKGGHNKKYRIKDGSGKTWVAKLGREAQPETAAVRLMWALGYKSEINYLVPTLTIPGKGTFRNVRLEARPDNIERLDEWKLKDNPFIGTKEYQGLKIMMVFLSNWDVVDVQNKILEVNGKNGKEYHYIVSDLGATFGKLGNNNFPIIYRLGRKTGNPNVYIKGQVVREVEDDRVVLSYKGKNRGIFKDISVSDAMWLARLLRQLSDKQIRDAFRAANYSAGDINTLTRAVKNRITELSKVTSEERLAEFIEKDYDLSDEK